MLQLESVEFRYGQRRVLHNVTLTLTPGSITLVHGGNGSGKSTLLRVMAGMQTPNAGTRNCNAQPGDIGYIGHKTLLYPDLSVLENVQFWLRLHHRRCVPHEITRLAERMGIAERLHQSAGTLSRGMAQRASLLRLFVLAPRLILLDEPETGLDTTSLPILYQELNNARDRGAALAWVSHHARAEKFPVDFLVVLANKTTQVVPCTLSVAPTVEKQP